MTAPGREGDGVPATSTVRLTAATEASLEDERLAATVVAAVKAGAERVGVKLRRVEIEPDGLELEVVGSMLVAVGLAAEIRRATDRWHLDRTGRHLWTSPDPEPGR